jgi:hypothetical protein
MRYFITVVTLLALATAASAAAWWGSADYAGHRVFDQIQDADAGGAINTMHSLRFTAAANMTVNSVKLDFSIKKNANVSGVVGIYTDDGSGNPNALIGGASASTALGTSQVLFPLSGAASLTAGNVYHVRLDTTHSDTTQKVRLSIRPAKQGGYNQPMVTGLQGSDSALAGLYWEGDDPDPNLYGWRDDQLASIGKSYDPSFGLYSDQSGTVAVGGDGYDHTDLFQAHSSGKKAVGESFILQNVPAAYVDANNQVEVAAVNLYIQDIKNNGGLRKLVAEIRDSTGANVLATGTLDPGSVVKKEWNQVQISHVKLTVGTRYIVTQSQRGGQSYYNRYDYVLQDYGDAVPIMSSFQGTQAYALRGDTPGALATVEADKDLQFQLLIPEPATMCLLAIGGVSVLLRKRR